MFKIKYDQEEIYDDKFFTHCCYCGKRIIVSIPFKYRRYKKDNNSFSCNDCISEKSGARDDINESTYTDISKKLWNE